MKIWMEDTVEYPCLNPDLKLTQDFSMTVSLSSLHLFVCPLMARAWVPEEDHSLLLGQSLRLILR